MFDYYRILRVYAPRVTDKLCLWAKAIIVPTTASLSAAL